MLGGMMPGARTPGGMMSGGVMPGGMMPGGVMPGGMMTGGVMPGVRPGSVMSGGVRPGGLIPETGEIQSKKPLSPSPVLTETTESNNDEKVKSLTETENLT